MQQHIIRIGAHAGDGIDLCYFEWGEADAPTVLLVHATGFHARCWDQTVAALPEGYRAVAVDMRGHGRSTKQGPYNWATFGADLSAFVEALELEDAVGVGHSMGGHCVTQAAAAHPGRFSRLVLVDPVMMEPQVYAENERARTYAAAEDHPVSKRRNYWQSVDEMYERFKDRHPFSLWRDEVLRDYCEYGVNPAPEGSEGKFELGCPAIVEASIYLGSAGFDILDKVRALPHPVTVIRGFKKGERENEMDFAQSPTWEGLAAQFPNGRDEYHAELTHFIPMQNPELVAAHIVDAQYDGLRELPSAAD